MPLDDRSTYDEGAGALVRTGTAWAAHTAAYGASSSDGIKHAGEPSNRPDPASRKKCSARRPGGMEEELMREMPAIARYSTCWAWLPLGVTLDSKRHHPRNRTWPPESGRQADAYLPSPGVRRQRDLWYHHRPPAGTAKMQRFELRLAATASACVLGAWTHRWPSTRTAALCLLTIIDIDPGKERAEAVALSDHRQRSR